MDSLSIIFIVCLRQRRSLSKITHVEGQAWELS
jgi:hypothetical protein